MISIALLLEGDVFTFEKNPDCLNYLVHRGRDCLFYVTGNGGLCEHHFCPSNPTLVKCHGRGKLTISIKERV